MSNNRVNNETSKKSDQEIADSDNSGFDGQEMAVKDDEDVKKKSCKFMDNLASFIDETDSTNIRSNDDMVNCKQFVSELKSRIADAKALLAYKYAVIAELDKEKQKINTAINLKNAASKHVPESMKIKPKHIEAAKKEFYVMKEKLHKLIRTLYPEHSDQIMDMLTILFQSKLGKEPNSGFAYIDITANQFKVVEILIHLKIVTVNPYDRKQIKLAYQP